MQVHTDIPATCKGRTPCSFCWQRRTGPHLVDQKNEEEQDGNIRRRTSWASHNNRQLAKMFEALVVHFQRLVEILKSGGQFMPNRTIKWCREPKFHCFLALVVTLLQLSLCSIDDQKMPFGAVCLQYQHHSIQKSCRAQKMVKV